MKRSRARRAGAAVVLASALLLFAAAGPVAAPPVAAPVMAVAWLAGPETAEAAPGDFEIVYDWTDPQAGFAGVATVFDPVDGQPGFETPYYTLVGQAGVGLRFATAISSGGVGAREYPVVDPLLNPGAGPRAMAQIQAPTGTRVLRARFDQIEYRRQAGERQFLRFAIYGGGAEAEYDTTDTAPAPGPFLNNTLYTPADFGTITLDHPTGAGQSVHAWLSTGCGTAPLPPPCGLVDFDNGQPRSHGRVGRIRIDLHDPDPPTLALAGSLTDGGWTNARGTRAVTITATDQGAGVRSVRLQRRRATGPWRTLLNIAAPCNPSHAGPPAPGRAAACPTGLERSFTQAMGQLSDGSYTYRATVTDDSDRQTTQTFTVRIDRRAPRSRLGGQLTTLARGWLQRADVVTATVAGSDKLSGVAAIDLYATENGRARLLATVPVCDDPANCPGEAARTMPVDLAAVAEGEVAVFAVARDAAGNVARASRKKKARFDRLAPEEVYKRPLIAKAKGNRLEVQFRHTGDDFSQPGVKRSGLRGFRATVTDSTLIETRGWSKVHKPGKTESKRWRMRLTAPKAVLKDAYVLVQAVDKAGNASQSRAAKVRTAKQRIKKPRRKLRRPSGKPKRPPVAFGFGDGNWSAAPPLGPDGQPLPRSRADAVRELRAAIRLFGKGKQKFVSLRFISPYDLWSRQDDKRDRWLGLWRDFVAAVNAYNATAVADGYPIAEPVVALMSHNFDNCYDVGVAPKAIRFPDPPSVPNETGICRYPQPSEYGKFFQQWLDNTRPVPNPDPNDPTIANRLDVKHWTAWNEPDHASFTLAHIDKNPEIAARKGGTLAAVYWLAAKQTCPACSILAGEFSEHKEPWVSAYKQRIAEGTRGAHEDVTVANKAQPAPPAHWTIHAYGALLPRERRKDTVRGYVQKLEEHARADHLGDFKVWITEIGAALRTGPGKTQQGKPARNLTNLNTKPGAQFTAGKELMRVPEVSPRIERIYYYGAWGPATPNFDSHLADHDGDLRPVICGIRGDKKLNRKTRCPGDPKTK